MKAHQLFLTALCALPYLASAPAHAASDPYDDLDDEGNNRKAKEDKDRPERKQAAVREIVKGTYAKANVGAAMYLGQFRGFVNPGTSLGLAFGQDFVDQGKMSMAWELMFFQGIHNGCHFESQVEGLCSGRPNDQGPLIQGDLRTYTFAATVEWATYPNRRVGIGLRAGGGVLLSPLLMEESQYQIEVVQKAWGGVERGFHGPPHPIAMGGPNFEYYTKLSHFSVGFDADVFYAIGFDLGASVTGALKYTF